MSPIIFLSEYFSKIQPLEYKQNYKLRKFGIYLFIIVNVQNVHHVDPGIFFTLWRTGRETPRPRTRVAGCSAEQGSHQLKFSPFPEGTFLSMCPESGSSV